MRLTYIDVKKTHEGVECPANRYVPHPHGGWVCLDCDRHVVLVSVEVKPVRPREHDEESVPSACPE